MSKNDRPALIFIRGVPGSGKSYLATALENSLGKENVLMLDPDTIDFNSNEYLKFSEALLKEGVEQKLHPFRWLRSKACEGIAAGKVIVWNQPFTMVDIFNRLITYLQNYATEHGTDVPVLIVEVDLDHNLAKERVLKRKQQGGHGPSEQTLIRRIDEYKSYTDQGYNSVTVHGDRDVAESVSAVVNKLAEL
jgi:adenylate kinase family enzyme